MTQEYNNKVISKTKELIIERYGIEKCSTTDLALYENLDLSKMLITINKDLIEITEKINYKPIFDQNYFGDIKFKKKMFVGIKSIPKLQAELLSVFNTILLEVIVNDHLKNPGELKNFILLLEMFLIEQMDNKSLQLFFLTWVRSFNNLLKYLNEKNHEKVYIQVKIHATYLVCKANFNSYVEESMQHPENPIKFKSLLPNMNEAENTINFWSALFTKIEEYKKEKNIVEDDSDS